MKTKILILFLLITSSIFAQGVLTPVDRLKIKQNPKKNDATRVMVQDSITKDVGWILKSTLGGGGGIPTLQEVLEQQGRMPLEINTNYNFQSSNKYQTIIIDTSDDIDLFMTDNLFNIGDEIEIYNRLSSDVEIRITDTYASIIYYKNITIDGATLNRATIPLYSKAWIKCVGTNVFNLVIQSQITTGGIPTLQEILDNNHNLVDGNNFQGSDAGVENEGAYVNGSGIEAASYNTGNNINALGTQAAFENISSDVNALGDGAASVNSGDNVNAFGFRAAAQNSGTDVNAFGDYAASDNTAPHVNAFGFFAGYEFSIANVFKNVNLFGFFASADADNQNVFSKWVTGTTKYFGRLSFNNITADRKWELPNASGTIALTSDITPATWGSITGSLWMQTDLQNALNSKANLAGPTFTGTVAGITKSMVGLANVDNTSDANKPISTTTQTALNLKADKSTTPSIVIRNITPSSALTIVTSETQITSFNFTIPANTFSATDLLKVETVAWEKSGTGGASTCRIKLSNTDNYATASNVLILAASGGNLNMRGMRTYKIAGGNLKGLMSNSANGIFTDNTLTSVAVSTLALDVTQPIYGFISLQNSSSTDSTIVNELIISKW
jgi:hypothetical protein